MAVNPKNIYIGERYVPIYGGEWVETQSYESLVIVTHNNDSYISNRPVPANIQITNSTYWAKMYGGNQQIEQVNDLVQRFQQQLDDMNTKLDELGQGGYVWKPAMAYNIIPGTDVSDALASLTYQDNIGFSAGEYIISKPITINAKCQFAPGAVIKSTANVTFAQEIFAEPDYPIFNLGNPADPVLYTIPNLVKYVNWYTAIGDGVSNCGYALQAISNAHPTGVYTIQLVSGVYILSSLVTFTATPNINGNGCSIVYSGNGLIQFNNEIEQLTITRTLFNGEDNTYFSFKQSVKYLTMTLCKAAGNIFKVDVDTFTTYTTVTDCIFTAPLVIFTFANNGVVMNSKLWVKNSIFTAIKPILKAYNNLGSGTVQIESSDIIFQNMQDFIVNQPNEWISFINCKSINNCNMNLVDSTANLTTELQEITMQRSFGINSENSKIFAAGGAGNRSDINLSMCKRIENTTILGNANLVCPTAPARVILENITVNDGTITLNGFPGAVNKVAIINCDFGKNSVVNNSSTFNFINSPWGSLNSTSVVLPPNLTLQAVLQDIKINDNIYTPYQRNAFMSVPFPTTFTLFEIKFNINYLRNGLYSYLPDNYNYGSRTGFMVPNLMTAQELSMTMITDIEEVVEGVKKGKLIISATNTAINLLNSILSSSKPLMIGCSLQEITIQFYEEENNVGIKTHRMPLQFLINFYHK